MKTTLSLFAVLLSMTLPVFAEVAVPKIGYVNVELALSKQVEAQKYTKSFEEEENKILKDEADARTSIEAKLTTFNSTKGKLTEEARMKQETQLGEEINKLQTQFAQRRMELNQKRQNILTQLQTKVQLQIESISRQGGYTMVLNSQAILFVSDAMKKDDLTDKLIAAYNKAYPEESKKAPVKPAPAKPKR